MTPFAFSTPTSSDEEQRRLFQGFRAAGFGGLQLKGGQYGRYLDAPQQFTYAWGSDQNAVSALICGGGLDVGGQESLRSIIRFASAVGAGRVVFCHGLPRAGITEEDIRGFAQILSGIGQEARQEGVALSLHHHYDQPVMSREDLRVFFAAALPGTVGLTLDTAHLAKSGVADIPGVIREFGGVIDNVHLKDFRNGQFVPLGQGEIAFGPIRDALNEIGYDGWLCADEESGASVTEGMEMAAAFLRDAWGA